MAPHTHYAAVPRSPVPALSFTINEMSAPASFEHLLLHHKLAGTVNWKDWSHTVQFILTAEGLDDYISKDHVVLTANDQAYGTWKKENARACLIVMLNCTQEPRNLISGLKTAKDMWARLEKFY